MITSSPIKKFVISLLIAALLPLAACGSKDSGDKGSGDKQEAEGVIPQAQLDAMEKAKAVEDVLKQAEEQRREEIDQQ